jgi:hypothetical protein
MPNLGIEMYISMHFETHSSSLTLFAFMTSVITSWNELCLKGEAGANLGVVSSSPIRLYARGNLLPYAQPGQASGYRMMHRDRELHQVEE